MTKKTIAITGILLLVLGIIGIALISKRQSPILGLQVADVRLQTPLLHDTRLTGVDLLDDKLSGRGLLLDAGQL